MANVHPSPDKWLPVAIAPFEADLEVCVVDETGARLHRIEQSPKKSQTREAAKGGLDPAHDSAFPSGDSPKPHGDPMRHVIEEQKNRLPPATYNARRDTILYAEVVPLIATRE